MDLVPRPVPHSEIAKDFLSFGTQTDRTRETSTEPGRLTTVRVARILAGEYWLGGPAFLRPVRAHIQPASDHVAAVQPDTGIFGVGDTLASAVTDLRSALAQHFDVLEVEEALSEDLASQLAFLRRHLLRA